MADPEDIFRDWPRIGCCGATCGDTCPCCCSNVRYADTITFAFTWMWDNTPGQPDCSAGSATVSFDLTNFYSDGDDIITGEPLPPVSHTCSWQWDGNCGDVTFEGNCRPGGEFGDFCFDATYYLQGAFFGCNCKVGPQPPDSPYAGMSQVGDGTQQAATCIVRSNDVGSSQAGWVGGMSWTTNPDCTTVAPGGGGCSFPFQINLQGVGSAPDDLNAFRTFGPCKASGAGCDPWRCCDPFSMTFLYGAWVFSDPGPDIWPYSPDHDYFDCDTGIAHLEAVDYPLSSIPFVTVTAAHTCDPDEGPPTRMTEGGIVVPKNTVPKKVRQQLYSKFCPDCSAIMCCGHQHKCPKKVRQQLHSKFCPACGAVMCCGHQYKCKKKKV